ncbi:SMI1/KNR4 family protein [Dickeya zeae]|uniref:SMI1/KNR4 family protein n=1 Tax=Dickeya zeae TaxID=204042 RepID=UPI000577A491|nr:SMI1/KNR4 family protein [Dickeya zeae]AUQ24811.1 SMI1/KNR4 family protein [Dickeya zeae]UJR57908.1 SMI1/KNR4 family protein [Dickeya zeae]
MAIKISIGIDYLDVKDVESKCGVNFPHDYVDFLTKYNGMFIDAGSYCTIPFSKVDNGDIDFQEVYGINAINLGFDLLRANDIRDEVMVFDNPFVIGADPGGNPFLMNCNSSDSAVYYWDRTHIHSDDGFDYQEVNEEGNIYKISDSFTDFYNAIMLNVGGDVNIIKERL